MKEKQIRALMVEPMASPKLVTLGNDLDSFQKAVSVGAPEQGHIEFVYLEDNVSVMVNEEGKLIGLEPNRRLGDDILCGVFYVVAEDEEGELVSLTPEQVEKYSEFFGTFESITADEIDHAIVVKFYPL